MIDVICSQCGQEFGIKGGGDVANSKVKLIKDVHCSECGALHRTGSRLRLAGKVGGINFGGGSITVHGDVVGRDKLSNH